ncbi:MAG: hypothetical protein KatS3mg111_1218 [Pirellulaceae bacterium]|nr:MAG: hypothetical protein KatS3mg111_1218 [Pirellulaceae bacterium]
MPPRFLSPGDMMTVSNQSPSDKSPVSDGRVPIDPHNPHTCRVAAR